MTPAGAIIKDARRAEGLTQRQLARRLGVSQPSIARLEASGDHITLATLRRTLAALGRTLELGAERSPSSYDETLLRENLELTPAERLERMRRGHARFSSLAGATRRARDGR